MTRSDGRTNKARLAADFVADVRRIQRESGKQMSGPLGLDRAELTRIVTLAQAIPPIQAMPPSLAAAAVALLERFEELCRRRETDIPDPWRNALYEHLAAELTANHQAIGGNARHLVSATLLHGDVSDLMTDPEFSTWRKIPSLLRHALRRHPSDPHGFLRQAAKNIARLIADPALAIWKDSPGMIQRAAFLCPQDPRKHLLRAVRVARKLENDPRFSLWRDSPSVYHRMALCHPANPRGYLTRVTELVHQLQNDPELAVWRNSPWVCKRAALNHPDRAKSMLLHAAASAKDLQREIADTDLRLQASRVRYAALTHPVSARQALRRKGTIQNIRAFTPDLSSAETSGRRYLAELRELQRQNAAGLGGSSPLTRHDDQAIAAGLAVSEGCRKLPPNIAETLTRLLEIMAVRRKLPIPTVLRPVIYDRLAREFNSNLAAYGGSPAKLVGVTIYQGDVSGLAGDHRLTCFASMPYMIRQAVCSSPCDPVGSLLRAAGDINRLNADPRFACWEKNPGVFHAAVSRHPENPEQFLLEVKAVLHRLETNPRFSSLRDSSWVFPYVAMRYRKEPEDFLERMMETVGRLQADPRFSRFQNSPWVFRRVALCSPTHPETTLRKAAETIDRLRRDGRFAEFADNPGILTDVAFKHPRNPAQFLRQTQKVIVRLKNDPCLKRFQRYHWAYIFAATRFGLHASGFLSRVAERIDRLSADTRLASLQRCPSVFLRTALYHPQTCEDLLLQAVHDPALRRHLMDGQAMPPDNDAAGLNFDVDSSVPSD